MLVCHFYLDGISFIWSLSMFLKLLWFVCLRKPKNPVCICSVCTLYLDSYHSLSCRGLGDLLVRLRGWSITPPVSFIFWMRVMAVCLLNFLSRTLSISMALPPSFLLASYWEQHFPLAQDFKGYLGLSSKSQRLHLNLYIVLMLFTPVILSFLTLDVLLTLEQEDKSGWLRPCDLYNIAPEPKLYAPLQMSDFSWCGVHTAWLFSWQLVSGQIEAHSLEWPKIQSDQVQIWTCWWLKILQCGRSSDWNVPL